MTLHCTCGVSSDLVSEPHEATCGLTSCEMCGSFSHTSRRCPDFAANGLVCCGADSMCQLCPRIRRAA